MSCTSDCPAVCVMQPCTRSECNWSSLKETARSGSPRNLSAKTQRFARGRGFGTQPFQVLDTLSVAAIDSDSCSQYHLYGAVMTRTKSLQHIDLSHSIVDGMSTYPPLPGPVIATHLSREDAEKVYGSGVTFHIGLITICTNTGTYLDVPFHRFADGHDLAGLSLDRVAGVPAVCLDRRGETEIEITAGELNGLRGHAVLVRTDHSRYFGTEAYTVEHPHLSVSTTEALIAADVACVGIDSLNIDGMSDTLRPVHTALLGAGIPIIEHLTNLAELPSTRFLFTAVPPKIVGAGTFTVRAYATVG